MPYHANQVKDNQEEKKTEAFSHQYKLFILRSDDLGFLTSIYKMKAQGVLWPHLVPICLWKLYVNWWGKSALAKIVAALIATESHGPREV